MSEKEQDRAEADQSEGKPQDFSNEPGPSKVMKTSHVSMESSAVQNPSTSITDLDVSEDNREKSGDEENQLVCGEALKTNEKLSFTPEVLNEVYKTVYRFDCYEPGVFQCAYTDLVFVTIRKVVLQYRTAIWDDSLLQSAGKIAAGVLFDIRSPEEDAVCRLHLPHCETMDAPLPDGLLSVVHITDDGMSILEPLEITDTHVIVEVPHLSRFGLVSNVIEKLWTEPIKSRVQLFLGLPNRETKKQKIHVHMLPWNIDRYEVKKQQPWYQHIKVNSQCKLIHDQPYTVHCSKSIKIQPKAAEFEMMYVPNHDPFFEIRLPPNTDKVTVTLKDRTQTAVWEQEVDLTDPDVLEDVQRPEYRSSDSRLAAVWAQFVDSVSEPVLNQLLDRLQQRSVISQEQFELAKTKNRFDKAQEAISMVLRNGSATSFALMEELTRLDPQLSKRLKLD